MFGGIGACSNALKRLNIPFEIVDYVEIDKYAVKSFNAIYGTNFEPQDIKNWNKNINVDLIMHGSPCQDFSLAGKQAGGDEGSGTRSSLMYETLRIVEKLKPKYVIWENVKNILSKKHRHNFDDYLSKMEQLGYKNYYQVLNAKDYEIPQNRERVFTISILGNESFNFPPKQELKLKLKDMLENKVDEKYYLSNDIIKNYIEKTENDTNVCGTLLMDKWQDSMKRIYDVNKYAPTINTYQGGNLEPKIAIQKVDIPQTVKVRKYPVDIQKLVEVLRKQKELTCWTNKKLANKLNLPLTKVEHWFRTDNSFAIPDTEYWYKLKEMLNITTSEFDKPIMIFEEREGVYEKSNRYYYENGISPTITGASADEKIIVNNKRLNSLIEKTNFEEGKPLNLDLYNQTTNENISQCLTEPNHNSQRLFDGLRIRKLTPKECWRLMGFGDEDFEKARQVNSDTQLYKQAGNSICVNVLVEIFKNLLDKEVK